MKNKNKNSSLIGQINGRDAIPVRAIPFVTKHIFDSMHTARILAHIDGWHRVDLDSYYLGENGEPIGFDPSEWETVVHKLEDLNIPSKGIVDKEKIEALYPGAFVWRDELESAFIDAKNNGVVNSNIEINYRPFIPVEISKELILEKFPFASVIHKRLPLEEAATELARQTGLNANRWLITILSAIKNKELRLKNPKDYSDNLPFLVPEIIEKFDHEVAQKSETLINDLSIKYQAYYYLTSGNEIDRWLDTHPEWKVDFRFCSAATTNEENIKSERTFIQKLPLQEKEILDWLTTQGYQPQSLPKNVPGKSGVKKNAREHLLKKTDVFQSKTVFDKAWQRLRDDGEIKDAS